MKNRSSVLNSPRLKEIKKKKNTTLRNKVILLIFTFLVIIISLSFLSKWGKINISNIEIIGNKIVDTDVIYKVVKEGITGKYLWLFSKSNILLYPKKKIEAELSTNFKRLKDISIKIKNANTLEVKMSEKLATYTWCGNDLPDENTKLEEAKCYFMDDSGYIFDEAPYFSGEVYFRFFGKTVGQGEHPSGHAFLPEKFRELVLLMDNVSNMNLELSAIFSKDDNEIEVYLSSNTSILNAPKIIFRYDSDFEKIAENLQAALTTEPLKSDLVSKYSSLLYIDLRFGNKVYYKFK